MSHRTVPFPVVAAILVAAAIPLAACRGGLFANRAPPPLPAHRAPAVSAAEGVGPSKAGGYEPGELPSLRAPLTKAGSAPTEEDRRIFAEANRVRAQYGLPAFRWDERLFRAAWDHTLEQHSYEYMGHGSPVRGRDRLADRVALAGYRGRIWAEVVAWGYDGPAAVVRGWMDSPGHRKILLDPRLCEAAFARVGDYFTGNFGAP